MKLFALSLAFLAGVLAMHGMYVLAIILVICAIYDQKGLLFE